MLATLEEAKKHLNIDEWFTDDDAYIESLIETAELIISKEVGICPYNLASEREQKTIPLKHAVLLLVTHFYEDRNAISYGSAVELPLAYKHIIELYKNY